MFLRPVLFFSLVLIAKLTHADEPVILLPDLVTVGDRLIRDDAARVVITEDEISHSGARNVGELLKRVAGVDFGANFSGSAYAYLRGSSSGQTLVFIDGVRANDATSPSRAFDFSTLDLAQIESIEVLKGPHAVEFGQGAGGGVILIQTRRLSQRAVQFREEAGARLSNRMSLLAGTPIGKKFSLETHLSQDTTRGFSYVPAVTGDDDGRKIETGTVRLRANPSAALEISAVSNFESAEQEIDVQVDDPDALTLTRSLRNSVSLKSIWSPNFEVQLDLARLHVKRTYQDQGNVFSVDELYRGTNDSADLTARAWVSPSWRVSAGTNFYREKMRNDGSPGISTYPQTRLYGGNVQSVLTLPADLAWEAGIRHDRPHQTASQTLYETELSKNFTPDLKVHSRFASTYRLPSLTDRFTPLYGNPSLRTEKSRAVELGVSGRVAKIYSFGITAFVQRYSELVTLSGAPFFIPYNTAKAEIRGLEATSETHFGAWTFIRHLTFLRGENRADRSELANVSRWKGGLIVQWDPADVWKLEAETLAKSSRRDTAGSELRARGYNLVNFAAHYAVSENLETFLRVENVLDRRYEEDRNYATPRRGVFGGFRVTL